jgi:hypothetical protein
VSIRQRVNVLQDDAGHTQVPHRPADDDLTKGQKLKGFNKTGITFITREARESESTVADNY